MTEIAAQPKRPTTPDELSAAIAAAAQTGTQIHLTGSNSLPLTRFDAVRPVQTISTLRMNKLLEHAIADMTVTVQAGITLESLQKQLAWHNQWLPIDPPAPGGRSPGHRTIAGLIATNSLGPLRFGCGDYRLLVLGMRWVDSAGTLIRAGGRTVKNSAGYQTNRLMIGACGSLGAIAEVTLRTYARPADEQCVLFFCDSYPQAETLLAATLQSATVPAYVEMIGGRSFRANPLQLPASPAILVIGFLGRPEVCTAQVQAVRNLNEARNIEAISQTAAQAGRLRLWLTTEPAADVGFRIHALSSQVCPLMEQVEALAAKTGESWLVAEAAAGIIRGSVKTSDASNFWTQLREIARARDVTILATQGNFPGTPARDDDLLRRLKTELDPQNCFGLPPVN